jgi:hypothetical protein
VFKPKKIVAPRILPLWFAALAACTSSPQEAAMRNLSQDPVIVARDSSDARTAARTVVPEPVSAIENPARTPQADLPAEAEGRRTLSTAFVRLGAGEHLTVEMRDGSTVVLRNVVMRARDFCGVQVSGGSAGTRYCGGYGDVAAARPGG